MSKNISDVIDLLELYMFIWTCILKLGAVTQPIRYNNL